MRFEVTNKKRNIFYQIMFFLGIILMVWEIFIYRKTIINFYLLWILILGIGSIATIIDLKNYKSTYNLNGVKLYFFAFMQNTLSWGFLACSILVLSNYYFSKGAITQKTFEIIDHFSMPGSKDNRAKRKALVEIDYEGQIKELVFSNQFYKELNQYRYVEISTKKGFLFWDIIVKQALKK